MGHSSLRSKSVANRNWHRRHGLAKRFGIIASGQQAARIGADWQTPVQGLKVGGRFIYTGAQWADSGNKLRVPSWNRLDLNASYAATFGATPVRFNASVENVTDKNYWIGTFGDGFVMPGAPRTFKVSATVSF